MCMFMCEQHAGAAIVPISCTIPRALPPSPYQLHAYQLHVYQLDAYQPDAYQLDAYPLAPSRQRELMRV